MSTPIIEEETHAVFATTYDHKIVRVSDPSDWDGAQYEWKKLDALRPAGRMPHVRYFEVRSMDDPKYKNAPLSLTHRRPVVKGSRGFSNIQGAARRAWRAFAPTFRSRYDKTGTDITARTGVQGTGGWFYFPNGVTVAQGLDSLAAVCRRRGMIVSGADGKWFVIDLDEPTVGV